MRRDSSGRRPAMIATELAEEIARRSAVVAAVVARHQDADAVTVAGRVCPSSGYCGCQCRPCLGGRHGGCGHKSNCHKDCRSL